MLSLFICSPEERVCNRSGDFYHAFPVLYKNKDGEAKELRYATDLPALDDVEVLLNIWRDKFVLLAIPLQLKRAIMNFFLFERQRQDRRFNCYSFVCEYKRVAKHEPENLTQENMEDHALERWNLRRVWLMPKVGDVVFLFSDQLPKPTPYFHHAAVYLGAGRYLSVWGQGGELEVTNLTQMRDWYGSTRSYVAIPK